MSIKSTLNGEWADESSEPEIELSGGICVYQTGERHSWTEDTSLIVLCMKTLSFYTDCSQCHSKTFSGTETVKETPQRLRGCVCGGSSAVQGVITE